jgi:hypothetical protein
LLLVNATVVCARRIGRLLIIYRSICGRVSTSVVSFSISPAATLIPMLFWHRRIAGLSASQGENTVGSRRRGCRRNHHGILGFARLAGVRPLVILTVAQPIRPCRHLLPVTSVRSKIGLARALTRLTGIRHFLGSDTSDRVCLRGVNTPRPVASPLPSIVASYLPVVTDERLRRDHGWKVRRTFSTRMSKIYPALPKKRRQETALFLFVSDPRATQCHPKDMEITGDRLFSDDSS